jgi:hypothetical protein
MRLATYVAAAVLAFVAATLGSDVIVSIFMGGRTLPEALAEHTHWATAEPAGTLWLFAPFAGLALLCSALGKGMRRRSGLVIFGGASLGLILLYLHAYQSAEQFAQNRMWTAATLTIAFVPLKAVVVLLIALGAIGVANAFDPANRRSRAKMG